MNKTVKTIAWICLVLGLLGVAIEVGVYVRARSFVAQLQESVEAGEFPMFKSRFSNGDIDDEDWDKDSFDRGEWFAHGEMIEGRRRFDTFSNSRGFLPGMRDRNVRHVGFALPFLLLASGPVLTVVGAVTLIVNREPKVKGNKAKKTSKKK